MKNIIKKQLYTAVFALILLFFFICGISYAWFRRGDDINRLFFQIAKINSEIMLYTAEDFNFNGVPDKDLDGNYIFRAHEAGIQYAQSSQNTADAALDMMIEDFLPTQVRTFRISIYNRSDNDNTLRFAFESAKDGNNSDISYYKYLELLSIRLGNAAIEKNSAGNSYKETSLEFYKKMYLAGLMGTIDSSGKGPFIGAELNAQTDKIGENSAHTTIKANETLYFWLQIEFETYESLQTRDGFFKNNEAEYQAAQGKDFNLPQLKIYLEIYR